MAEVAAVCSSQLENLGRGGCIKSNPFAALTGIIMTTEAFQFDTAETFATQANYIAGIKAGTVIPMLNLWDYEDQSVEPTMAESGRQKRKVTRQGDYRFNFMWDLPFDVHKKLQSFRNASIRVFLVDEAGHVYGTQVGATAKGFSTSMVNPNKMTLMPSGSDAPALTSLTIDFNNQKEWNEDGVYVDPTWDVEALVPLTDVTLEIVGSPTTSLVVVRVYKTPGLTSAGVVSKIGISGIVQADFDVDFGTATSMTDNGDGTYSFASTAAFSTGAVNLVAPSAMASVFDELYIKSTGAATATIA
jgi:hypothetical protein